MPDWRVMVPNCGYAHNLFLGPKSCYRLQAFPILLFIDGWKLPVSENKEGFKALEFK